MSLIFLLTFAELFEKCELDAYLVRILLKNRYYTTFYSKFFKLKPCLLLGKMHLQFKIRLDTSTVQELLKIGGGG